MKRRLMLFLIIIVLATLIFWSNACLVFSPDRFFENGSRSQSHNLVTATSEGAEEALIILSTENEESMGESIDYICARGGRITHIYPPHTLIGNLPRAISQQLIGQKGIEGIYYSIVDSSQFKKYGDVAVFAIEAWNNNFMGQASINGLTPDPEAPEPGPIEADMKIPPPLNESKDLQIVGAPYGAGFYDTSEYMIGKISVVIILPESNGAIDWNQENWASWDISNVVSEIQAGLNWWAAREWKANLQFTYTIHVTATSYEPINNPQSDQYLWIGEVMYNIGYRSGSYFDRVRAYLNDRRNWDHTDWAFAIFVAHSWWDLDGKFADGKYFAYAYLGGPFLVMTYDNDGYGIANMDAVTAHETGHVFYALDEYSGSGDQPTDRSGYLNVENQNHEDGGSSNVACIMRGGTSGYTQGAVCYYTRGQIGWRDTDSDGILDIIDFEPDTVLTSYSPDPTQDNTPTYSGTAYATATYPNRNPYRIYYHPPPHDITINIITRVQYRIGGGAWMDATPTDGTFDQTIEYFTFTASPLASGTYTFQVRALNSAGNWETSYASDTLTITIGYTVTFYTDPTSGTITADGATKSNGATGTYSAGQRVHVVANPPSGYSFSSWEVSGISVDSTSSQDTYMTVSNNGWLKAHFVIQTKPSLLITLTDISFLKGQTVTITVTIFNPTPTPLASTLYIEISGPTGYYYFDFSQVSVAANSFASYSFTWQVPSDAAIGTYQISTGLVPPILTAYDVKYVGVM